MGAKDRHGEGGVRRCREQRQGHETDMNSETEGTQEVRWGGERDGDGHAKRFVPCCSHPPLCPSNVLHTALLLGSLATGLAGVKRGRCLMAGHQPQ